MFFHRCSYKNSCFSELAYNSIVLILILWSEASKTCSQKYFFGFLVLVLKWWLASYTPSMSSYWLAKHLNINYIVLQRCNLPFFVLKTFKFFLNTTSFVKNLEMMQMAGGGGSCSLRRCETMHIKIDMWFTPKGAKFAKYKGLGKFKCSLVTICEIYR